jgi:hypothetical protein
VLTAVERRTGERTGHLRDAPSRIAAEVVIDSVNRVVEHHRSRRIATTEE